MKIPIFDGHNDALTKCMNTGRSFLKSSEDGQLDLPRARLGGMVGGFFAIYIPPEPTAWGPLEKILVRTETGYDVALPPECAYMDALSYVQKALAYIFRLVHESNGQLKICRTVPDIESGLACGQMAMVLHLEGAEAVDENLDNLYIWHAAGGRSLGLVWSRANRFGSGVPFRFPSPPDTGPGLTPAGQDLVRICNELGILIDVSHLTEKGFWDVARISDAPLVATHSAAHALTPTARNLTDRQLAAIKETDGVVGCVFNTADLRPDGERIPDTPLTYLIDHIRYLADRLGVDGVAFGSDFDGAMMPTDLGDVTGFPKILSLLQNAGFSADELQRIASRNWLRILAKTWKNIT